MSAVGHNVELHGTPDTAGNFEALILSVEEAALPRLVAALTPDVYRGQIIVHTCLGAGVQALDELETRGAVVIAAAPLSPEYWAVTTADELGETIASLLLAEVGANALPIPESERGALSARVAHVQMLWTLTEDAMFKLEQSLGGVPLQEPGHPAARQVMASFEEIEDPGLRRTYVDCARRLGEVEHDEELELWALQKEIP